MSSATKKLIWSFNENVSEAMDFSKNSRRTWSNWTSKQVSCALCTFPVLEKNVFNDRFPYAISEKKNNEIVPFLRNRYQPKISSPDCATKKFSRVAPMEFNISCAAIMTSVIHSALFRSLSMSQPIGRSRIQ